MKIEFQYSLKIKIKFIFSVKHEKYFNFGTFSITEKICKIYFLLYLYCFLWLVYHHNILIQSQNKKNKFSLTGNHEKYYDFCAFANN